MQTFLKLEADIYHQSLASMHATNWCGPQEEFYFPFGFHFLVVCCITVVDKLLSSQIKSYYGKNAKDKEDDDQKFVNIMKLLLLIKSL